MSWTVSVIRYHFNEDARETMQEKIQFLLDDPTTYQKMSKAAYESIQPYTWGNVIKQYEKYFEKIYEKSQKMGVL